MFHSETMRRIFVGSIFSSEILSFAFPKCFRLRLIEQLFESVNIETEEEKELFCDCFVIV
jgi:hypothetical protein